MKTIIAVLALTSLSAFANTEVKDGTIKDMYFEKTKNGFAVNIAYIETLGIKAFYDISTNVSFKPNIECEYNDEEVVANIKMEKEFGAKKNPEKSRFYGGTMVTSYTRIKLKTHKLCDGDLPTKIVVNDRMVRSYGVKDEASKLSFKERALKEMQDIKAKFDQIRGK